MKVYDEKRTFTLSKLSINDIKITLYHLRKDFRTRGFYNANIGIKPPIPDTHSVTQYSSSIEMSYEPLMCKYKIERALIISSPKRNWYLAAKGLKMRESYSIFKIIGTDQYVSGKNFVLREDKRMIPKLGFDKAFVDGKEYHFT